MSTTQRTNDAKPYIKQRLIPSIIRNTLLSIKYKSFIDPKARIYFPKKLKLGKGCVIGNSIIDAKSEREIGIEIGESSIICDYVHISTHKGHIKIGNHTAINHFCEIQGTGGLEIGDNVAISPHVSIFPFSHNFQQKNILISKQGKSMEGIKIGNDVWIGANCVILDGVTIGNGVVLGAGTIVNKDISDYSIAVGVPAKIIKKRGD